MATKVKTGNRAGLVNPVAPVSERRTTVQEGGVPNRQTLAAPVLASLGLSLGDADVTDELLEAAPTFGNMLKTVGVAVANAQRALDESVIQTVQKMVDSKVQIATEVVQFLNDDGLPDASKTEVVTQEVSLISLATPPLHEWKQVALTMDLDVSEIDARAGITFKQEQATLGLQFGVGGFGASGSVSFDSTSIDSRFRSDFARGTLTLDATLGPRATTKFQDPVKILKGPLISVSVGALRTDKNAGVRTVSLDIKVRKGNGDVNSGKPLEITAPGLLSSLSDSGITRTSDGGLNAELTRTIGSGDPPPPQQFTVTITMRQIRRVLQVAV